MVAWSKTDLCPYRTPSLRRSLWHSFWDRDRKWRIFTLPTIKTGTPTVNTRRRLPSLGFHEVYSYIFKGQGPITGKFTFSKLVEKYDRRFRPPKNFTFPVIYRFLTRLHKVRILSRCTLDVTVPSKLSVSSLGGCYEGEIRDVVVILFVFSFIAKRVRYLWLTVSWFHYMDDNIISNRFDFKGG